MRYGIVKKKISALEIIIRFLFGFLVPYVAINGIILFTYIQTPNINFINESDQNYENGKVKFTIDSILPVSNVSVLYQGIGEEDENTYANIEVKKDTNNYVFNTDTNGTYKIEAKILNGAVGTTFVDVNAHDIIPPTIHTENAMLTSKSLIITVSDDTSEINYDKIYADTDNGETLTPVYTDKSSGTVRFEFESGSKWIVHVEDVEGNEATATFTASN